MLRKIRQVSAILCLVFLTLLFLDFTGTLHSWFGWLAKIQFLPAVLALNVGIILFLIVLTLICGRIYCSVICPLGVFQDVIARFGKLSGKRGKLPYSYSPALSWLRYGILTLFIAALIAGVGSVVALLAPYSAYGRIAGNLFQPVWMWGNNALAYLAERMDSYAFYRTDIWLKSIPTFIIAVVTVVVLAILAWRNGRTYCNTICPVGTILGFLSRFSAFRIVMDTEKCTQCSLCSRNCKSACIDYKNYRIDGSRCVSCMDCLTACRHDAIAYRFTWNTASKNGKSASPSADSSRRRALSATVLLAVSGFLKAQEKKTPEVEMKRDGGLAPIGERKEAERLTRISPPGSLGLHNMEQHCTACQLCVSTCPTQILRPSGNLMTLMQPEMSYEQGHCRPECTKCSEVCPTGAIRPITKADKSAIQIGHAVWVKDRCVVLTDDVECGNCARHCPVTAIQMIPLEADNEKSHKIPAINVEVCIGCGACEHLCPSRPYTAIYVEGHERHRII